MDESLGTNINIKDLISSGLNTPDLLKSFPNG
jgi:hypothetical protein